MPYVPPLRDDLRGATPYGAPQLDVPVRLNTNENPFPPSPALARAIGAAAADAAANLNRYPDREARALRERLAGYLAAESGAELTVDELWVANGSNEVMQHVFAAFGGPGRMALGFSPTYSMYEQYARDTFTRFVTVKRSEDFSLDATTVVAAMLGGSPSIVVLTSLRGQCVLGHRHREWFRQQPPHADRNRGKSQRLPQYGEPYSVQRSSDRYALHANGQRAVAERRHRPRSRHR